MEYLAHEETIPGVVERAAQRFGSTDALVGEDGSALRYTSLWFGARLAASALIARGVEPGDRVALLADNSPAWAIANLAVLCTGAAVVPLNTRWRDAEIDDILDRARCRLVLRHGDVAGLPSAGAPHASDDVDARVRALAPDDVSHVQFTSGTTGRPKGALLTHRGMVRTTQEWVRVVGLTANDRYPVVNPFSHIGGHKTGLLACLCAGGTAYPVARFDAERLRALVTREHATFLQGPPAMFQGLLDAIDASGEPAPRSVRVAVTGSANIPPALVVRMTATFGLRAVHAGYGLTEATGVCTITRADDPLELVTRTSGRAVPGVDVRVADTRTDTSLPTGDEGEIQVRGPGVMAGYLDDPDATAAALTADGWLHTGDIGVLDADGNLAICDRIKDMVIVGGFNAYPAEIERVLAEHPQVAEAAVVGVPDARLGEVPVAFVVGDGVDEAAVAAWAHDRLASYKVPRAVFVVDALPLTAVPKVDKPALRVEAAHRLGAPAAP